MPSIPFRFATCIAATGICMTTACSTLTKGDRNPTGSPPRRQESGQRPLAIVADSRITTETLLPALLESAGAAVLEESILDVALDREISRLGLTFTVEDIARERDIVLQTVAEESQVDIDRAANIVDELRRERGLGPRRYQSQLLRNAKLRALVNDSISVSAEEIELAKVINFGEKVRARLISVASERDIAEIRARLLETPPDRRSAEFATIAIARSTDPSARRGGDLGFISPDDPALPLPLREQLRSIPFNQPTDPAIFGEGYAIAIVENRVSATTPPAEDDIKRRVMLRKQRVAMDELANRLIAGADTTVFDESLRWSWERKR